MVMNRIGLAMLAAGLGALATGNAAWAQNDTFRLGTSSVAVAAISGGTDTELVAYRGGHGHYGHYGHYGHGHYGHGHYGHYGHYGHGNYGHYGHYHGYYGGNRGYGYGGYRGYYGYGGYYPYYNYYRPYVSIGFYQPYYATAPAYYYSISGQGTVAATYAQEPLQTPSATLPYQTTTGKPQLLPLPSAAPQTPASPQTFPYDGGPQAPLPMPQTDPASGPRPTVPLQGKVVSLPMETTGGTSQLYMVGLGTHQPAASSSAATPAQTRYTYPAYGEQQLPAVRKQVR